MNWAKTSSTSTNLEDYIIIPKFEPKDFLYLFLITYIEERENKEIRIIRSRGFLFNDSINKELDSILYASLNSFAQQELNDENKNDFQNYGN